MGASRCSRAALAGRHVRAAADRWVRMNPIEKVIRRVDAVQQRHKAAAFSVGLIKK